MALLTPSKAAAAVGAVAVVLATIRASSVLAFVVTPAVAVLLALAASFTLDLWKVCVSREVAREDRLRQALKPLSFTTSSAWSAGLTRLSWEERGPSTAFPIHPNMPKTLQRFVDELLSFVRRDYIMPWYTKLSPSPAFGNAVELMIRQSLAALGDRAEAVDWATLAVTKMVPLLKDHILHFKTVESTQATSHGDSDPPLALTGKPHPAVAPQHTPSLAPAAVEEHLRKVAERALDHILPPKERASAAVRIMAREIVTTTILMPIVDVLSDGDFWNRMIEEKGKRLLNEEKRVMKFLSALESSRPRKQPKTPTKGVPPATISISATPVEFDAFMRSMSRVKALGNARHHRADIDREIRRATDLKRHATDVVEARRLHDHIERLLKARHVIETRIAYLAGAQLDFTTAAGPVDPSELPDVSLGTILSNQASTSSWLEHMDRRGRVVLVQFWLLVEGLKDPLEALQDPLGADDHFDVQSSDFEPQKSLSGDSLSSSILIDGHDATETITRDDVLSLWYTYFADDQINVPAPLKDVVRQYTLSTSSSISNDGSRIQLARVRQAVFAAQRNIYQQMVERDWEDFRRSELYRKALADLGGAQDAGCLSPQLGQPTPLSPQPSALPLRPQFPALAQRVIPERSVTSGPTFSPFPLLGKLIASSSEHAPRPRRPSTSPVKVSVPDIVKMPTNRNRHFLSRGITWSATAAVPVTPPPHAVSQESLDELVGSPLPADSRPPLFGDDSDEEEDFNTKARVPISKRQQADLTAALTTIIAGDDVESLANEISEPSIHPPLASPASSLVLPDRPQVSTNPVSVARHQSTRRSFDNLKQSLELSRGRSSGPEQRPTPQNSSSGDLNDDDGGSEDESRTRHVGVTMGVPSFRDQPLPVAIARLTELEEFYLDQIRQLQSFMDIAELHASDEKWRLCRQSLARVRSDLTSVQLQLANYIQQQDESRLLAGETSVSIPEVAPSNGVYWFKVVVTRAATTRLPEQAWTLNKRFRQFDELRDRIQEWLNGLEPESRNLIKDKLKRQVPEFPSKSVISKSSLFQEYRRQTLERYLQALVSIPEICASPCVQAYLARRPQDLSSSLSILRESLAHPSNQERSEENALQKLFTTIGNVSGQFVEDLAAGPTIMLSSVQTAITQQATDLSNGFGDLMSSAEAESSSSFVQPIQDLLMVLLDYSNSGWISRRNLVIMMLQSLAGGTIEKQIRALPSRVFSFEALECYVTSLRDTFWPDGIRRQASVPRTDEEKRRTQAEAIRKFFLLIPDPAVKVCGKSNVLKGVRRVFGVLQDRRLNQHLVLTVIDDIMDALFPPPVAPL